MAVKPKRVELKKRKQLSQAAFRRARKQAALFHARERRLERVAAQEE